MLTGFIVTLMTAAPAAAQAPMWNAICGFGGHPRPFPATSTSVSFIQSVVCNQQITNIDLSVEIWVMPEGTRTWEFVAGETRNGPPIVVSASPFQSVNSTQATSPPSRPCKNGIYVGRSFAWVQLGDWFDGGMLQSPPITITSCPAIPPPPNPQPPPGPDLPPLPPPTTPMPRPTIDQVVDQVKDQQIDIARAIIISADFRVGTVTRENSEKPVDTVIRASRSDSITVALVVSAGRLSYGNERFLRCDTAAKTTGFELCSQKRGTACTREGELVVCKVPGDFDNGCDYEPMPNSPAKPNGVRQLTCTK